MHIGIAGLGRMGAAMALRLLEVGHTVTVWNRSPDKLKAAVEAGAKAAATPAELASAADVTLTILTDEAAIASVYEGPHGLLAGHDRGQDDGRDEHRAAACHHGSGRKSPRQGRRAHRLPRRRHGWTGAARQAVWGSRAAPRRTWNACGRCSNSSAGGSITSGPLGSGASMKLAINLPLAISFQALGEAYILCRDLGLDPAYVMEIFSESSGATTMLKTRAPAIAQVLAGKPGQPPAVAIEVLRKDVATMVEEARGRGAELPLASVALAILEQAEKAGWGGKDATELPSFWPASQKSSIQSTDKGKPD